MTDHPNVAVFHRVMTAVSAGDMDAFAEAFHPDVMRHIGGRNRLAGDHRGRGGTFALFSREFQLTGGTYRPELHDVLANDDHTVALLHVTRHARAGGSIWTTPSSSTSTTAGSPRAGW